MKNKLFNLFMRNIFLIISIFTFILIPISLPSVYGLDFSAPVSDTIDNVGVTSQNSLTVSGGVGSYSSGTKIKIYVNSKDIPSRIQENGKFEIEVDAEGKFNATVLLSNFKHNNVVGLNEIIVEIAPQGGSKQDITKYIRLDVVHPKIYRNDIPNIINTPELKLEGYVDEKATLVAKINNDTQNIPIKDDNTFEYILSLGDDGDYEIELIATDDAGNIVKDTFITTLDTEPCTIEEIKDRDNLERETQHFTIVEIKGKTSEPGCSVKFANIGDKPKLNVSEFDDYMRDSLRTDAAGEVSVGGLIVLGSKEVRSNSKGEFSALIVLRQNIRDTAERYSSTITRRERLDDLLEGINNIQIIVEDSAGNRYEDFLTIKFDPGSSFWKLGRVQTLPNTVYSNQLLAEQSNGVEVSVMYDLYYIGPSKNLVSNPTVSAIPDGNKLDNQYISIGETFYHYYEEEGRLFVLTKIRVNPRVSNVKELKDAIGGNEIGHDGDFGVTGSGLQLDFALANTVSFNLGEEARPNEQIFLKHAVGVETPFDYTKFLTPEMLEKMINNIEDWNKLLEKAVKIADDATLLFTGMCVVKSAFDFVGGATDESLRSTYAICDRVWCPSIPPKCENVAKVSYDKNTNARYVFDEATGKYIGSDGSPLDSAPGEVIFEQSGTQGQGDTIATYRWIDGKDAKSSTGTRICGEGYNTIEIRTRNESSGSLIIGGGRTTSAESIRYDCTPSSKKDYYSLPAQSGAIGCYNAEAPSYDDVKCIPGNAEAKAAKGGADTYDDIFTSAECGCISGVRGNLANVLRVSQGFKKCLQQAQIGEVSGAYCERLFAHFTCDLVAGLVEDAFDLQGASKVEKSAIKGSGPNTRYNAGQVKTKLENRYGGILQSRFGLPSDQFVRKACIGAITGDWSDLEAAFRQAGRIPVKPVVGPMIPESRFNSWNPFTGEASIGYYLTIGVLSGGQEVTGTMKIICDKRESGGEYCPSDKPLLVYEHPVYVEADGSQQENVFYEDQRARYWGNVAVLELSYLEGGQQKHISMKENIAKKNNILAQCSFQAPLIGFTCTTISGGLLAAEFKDALLSPDVNTYYPGNDVYVKSDIFSTSPKLLEGQSAGAEFDNEDLDLYLVYYMRTPDGTVETNANSVNNRNNNWRINLKDPEAQNIFLLKHFEDSFSSTNRQAKFWSASKVRLNQDSVISLPSGARVIVSASGGQGSGVNSNLGPRNIGEVSLYADERRIDCTQSASSFICQNERNEELKIDKITYTVVAENEDNTGKLILTYQDGKQEINLGIPSTQRIGSSIGVGNYNVNLTLYNDVDRNGIIDGKDDPVPFGNDKSQTKLLSFAYNNKFPDECREPPRIEILSPNIDSIVTEDMRSGVSNRGVEFTLWDDCNDIESVRLYDSSTYDVMMKEVRDSENNQADKTVIEGIYSKNNYVIDSLSSLSRSSGGVYALGSNPLSNKLKYSYRDGSRFDLIIRVVDGNGNVGEERISVTKSGGSGSGGSGIVSATPVEVEQCRLSGGVCRLSCDAGQRNLGSCGDGVCCG